MNLFLLKMNRFSICFYHRKHPGNPNPRVWSRDPHDCYCQYGPGEEGNPPDSTPHEHHSQLLAAHWRGKSS